MPPGLVPPAARPLVILGVVTIRTLADAREPPGH
jgi:hypothetical protein